MHFGFPAAAPATMITTRITVWKRGSAQLAQAVKTIMAQQTKLKDEAGDIQYFSYGQQIKCKALLTSKDTGWRCTLWTGLSICFWWTPLKIALLQPKSTTTTQKNVKTCVLATSPGSVLNAA